MMALSRTLAILLCSCGVAAAQPSIRYLQPADFLKAPSAFRQKLEKLGCKIPQSYEPANERTNVISGHFARPAQKDWAALCSRNGESDVVFQWGGASRCDDPVLRAFDDSHAVDLQQGFNRTIAAVSPKQIEHYARDYGKPVGFRLTHEAIAEVFVGKASVVHYCRAGKWHSLQGAD